MQSPCVKDNMHMSPYVKAQKQQTTKKILPHLCNNNIIIKIIPQVDNTTYVNSEAVGLHLIIHRYLHIDVY